MNATSSTAAKMWLLVADQARARLFRVDDANGSLHELQDVIDPEGRARDQDLVTDRPGRTFDSASHNRHAMEPSTDPVETETIRFAKRLAAKLEEGRVAGSYQRLGLVAAPEFLGHLRKSLSKATTRCVALEVDKDLSRADADSLRKRLPDKLFDELA